MHDENTRAVRDPQLRFSSSEVVGLYHAKRRKMYRFDECVMLGRPKRILTIGRCPDADIRLTDRMASYIHCTICRLDDGTWAIRDAESKNGLWANDLLISDSVLRVGMWIVIGQTDFIASGDDGIIPITARTERSFFARAVGLYGSIRRAAERIKKPRSTVARRIKQAQESHTS